MAWLPFGSWSSNREKDGHSRLLGGLINLLDGCTVRYFDQVGALSSGGTERGSVGNGYRMIVMQFCLYTHGYSIMELPFGKLGDADCRGAEGDCRRALKKGRMTEAFCVDSHRRRQTVDAQKWFGTFEANLVMRCDGRWVKVRI
ncbi:unnamed protein product [Prunus brigantina]